MPMFWIPWFSFPPGSFVLCTLNHNVLFFEITWSRHICCQDIPSWPCLWLFTVYSSIFCSYSFFLHCWHSSTSFVHPFFSSHLKTLLPGDPTWGVVYFWIVFFSRGSISQLSLFFERHCPGKIVMWYMLLLKIKYFAHFDEAEQGR